MTVRLLSLGLRGGGLLGKFVLIFFLARVLPPAELGTYGLLTVTLGYLMYLLGLDFYTYAGRAMAESEKSAWPGMLVNQAALYVLSYAVVLPLTALVFGLNLLPPEYMAVFFMLLILEHLGQEGVRILVFTGRPLAAGFILFLRMGAWCYLIIAAHWLGWTSLSLYNVFHAWAASNGVALVVTVFFLRSLPWSRSAFRIDRKWIVRGLKVAGLFLLGTLALRGILTLDRYLVEHFAGLEQLGVYTLFWGIANSLMGFIDAAVFSFRYPRLITIYKQGDPERFLLEMRSFTRQTLLATAVLAGAAAVLVIPVLHWIGRPLYIEQLPLFYLMLATTVMFAVGHIPHYVLYAAGQDRLLVAAHALGLVIFSLVGVALAAQFGAMGVAGALLIAFTVLGFLKQWRSHRLVHALSCAV